MCFLYIAMLVEVIFGKLLEWSGILKNNNLIFENLIIFINSCILIYSIEKKYKGKIHKRFRRYLILSMLLRILCSYLNVYSQVISYFVNGDEVKFERALEQYYYTGVPNMGNAFSWTIFIMGAFYQIFGIQQLLLQYLHITLFIISAMYVYDILVDITKGRQIRTLVIVWMLFEPMLVFSTAITNRESPIVFLITHSIFYFYKWYRNEGNRYIALAMINAIIAGLMHAGVYSLVLGYLIIYFCYKPNKGKFVWDMVRTLVFAFSILFIIFLYRSYGMELFGKLANIGDVIDVAERAAGETGTAIYTSAGSNASSVLEIILYTPIRSFYFVFSPVPWDWKSLKQVIAFLTSSLFWIMIFYSLIRYFMESNKQYKNFLICLIGLIVLFIGVFAWGTRGANAAIRHREKIIGIMALVWAVSDSEIKRKRKFVFKKKRYLETSYEEHSID